MMHEYGFYIKIFVILNEISNGFLGKVVKIFQNV